MSDWHLQDTNEPIDASAAVELLRIRTAEQRYETWFESDDGQLLAIVTNGERAMVMVMLLQDDGDPGEHAIDASADASENTGFGLDNGQIDTYPDRDTVPFETAMQLVHEVLSGNPRQPTDWRIDG